MKNDLVYLKHILDSISKIESYTSQGEAVFKSTDYLQDATIRQLEIIGEATKQINEQTKNKDVSIPWKKMAGLRDVLIHDYMGVDIDTVWNISQLEIPKLRNKIKNILDH